MKDYAGLQLDTSTLDLWQEYTYISNEPIEPNDASALAVSFSTSLGLSAKDK